MTAIIITNLHGREAYTATISDTLDLAKRVGIPINGLSVTLGFPMVQVRIVAP